MSRWLLTVIRLHQTALSKSKLVEKLHKIREKSFSRTSPKCLQNCRDSKPFPCVSNCMQNDCFVLCHCLLDWTPENCVQKHLFIVSKNNLQMINGHLFWFHFAGWTVKSRKIRPRTQNHFTNRPRGCSRDIFS